MIIIISHRQQTISQLRVSLPACLAGWPACLEVMLAVRGPMLVLRLSQRLIYFTGLCYTGSFCSWCYWLLLLRWWPIHSIGVVCIRNLIEPTWIVLGLTQIQSAPARGITFSDSAYNDRLLSFSLPMAVAPAPFFDHHWQPTANHQPL